jgi:hypothetical protein
MATRCPLPFELSTLAISAGVLAFINKSLTAKAVLAAMEVHVVRLVLVPFLY